MSDNEVITLDKLEQWCREYDMHEGCYPESKFEGASVFEFLRWKITGEFKSIVVCYDYEDYDIINLKYALEEDKRWSILKH